MSEPKKLSVADRLIVLLDKAFKRIEVLEAEQTKLKNQITAMQARIERR